MNLFTSIFKTLFKIGIGFAIALVLAEIILQCLPVKTGFMRPKSIETGTPPHWQPDQTFTYSAGWRMDNPQTGKINNMGYPTPVDFDDNAEAIIVIGDSFVENQMNPWDDSFMGLMANDAPYSVYAFGLSGAQAADYIAIARYATVRYRPRHMVIVMQDGDLESATTPYQPGHYYLQNTGETWTTEQIPYSHDNATIRNFFKQSALIRYVMMNLQLQRKLIFKPHQAANDPTSTEVADMRPRFTYMVDEICAQAKKGGFKIILITESQELTPDQFQRLSRQCPRINFVDAAALKDRLTRDNPLIHLTHEPYDGHWNATMHSYIYEEIRPSLGF